MFHPLLPIYLAILFQISTGMLLLLKFRKERVTYDSGPYHVCLSFILPSKREDRHPSGRRKTGIMGKRKGTPFRDTLCFIVDILVHTQSHLADRYFPIYGIRRDLSSERMSDSGSNRTLSSRSHLLQQEMNWADFGSYLRFRGMTDWGSVWPNHLNGVWESPRNNLLQANKGSGCGLGQSSEHRQNAELQLPVESRLAIRVWKVSEENLRTWNVAEKGLTCCYNKRNKISLERGAQLLKTWLQYEWIPASWNKSIYLQHSKGLQRWGIKRSWQKWRHISAKKSVKSLFTQLYKQILYFSQLSSLGHIFSEMFIPQNHQNKN